MKIVNCIFCEDVRTEASGKPSLMGVHGDTIVLQVPKGIDDNFNIRLGVFIDMVFDDTDSNNNISYIKFHLKNGKTNIPIGRGSLPKPQDISGKRMTLTAVSTQFSVDVDDELNVSIELYNDKKELVEIMSPENPAKFKKEIMKEFVKQ